MAIDVSICVPSPTPNPLVRSLPQPSLFPLLSLSPRRRPLLTESIRASLHLSSHHISPSLPPSPLSPSPAPFSTTALVSADVRRGARGGGGGEGVEPQSGNRSEAAQLHLAADLAARDQPHELPAHGKQLKHINLSICGQARSLFLLRLGGNNRIVPHLCV